MTKRITSSDTCESPQGPSKASWTSLDAVVILRHWWGIQAPEKDAGVERGGRGRRPARMGGSIHEDRKVSRRGERVKGKKRVGKLGNKQAHAHACGLQGGGGGENRPSAPRGADTPGPRHRSGPSYSPLGSRQILTAQRHPGTCRKGPKSQPV